LPFKNLSNDSTQEYFSDGQTDAITTALAQLPGLTLVAPQSAFLLGKHNANLRTIDELLHVNYVIDGTVNRADKQVRVAARLIEVASSRIAWASSFNRQVTNVMSLQDDVARLIAASVQETLKLPGAARARTPVPALSNEAGTELLQAKAQLRQRARAEPGGPLTTAGELLESVVQRAPTYFPAQALLVQVYGFIVAYHALFSIDDVAKQSAFNDQWLSKAENAAVKATALAPDNPIAIAAMGLSQNLRGNVIAAEECYRRAYGMAAANTDIIHLYSLLLLNAGYIGQAGAMRKKLQELEPLVPVYAAFNVTSAWVSGDAQRAQKLLESSMIPIPAEHPFSARQHGLIYASQGKFREASNAVLRAAKTYDTQMVRAASELLLAAGTGSAYSAPDLGFFSILNVYSGKPERALEYFETSLKAGFWQAAEPAQFWHPSKEFAALRRTARFRKMVQGTQLAGLWQTRGKPDLCKIANPEDFCGR
jgi:adenylate cyclase